ncbi:MAG: hypothetical protein LBH76_01540, partial [Propionibacteriaceae bacterium]|nr:hypothetical protein [Propionibacteriaceae bacterium]
MLAAADRVVAVDPDGSSAEAPPPAADDRRPASAAVAASGPAVATAPAALANPDGASRLDAPPADGLGQGDDLDRPVGIARDRGFFLDFAAPPTPRRRGRRRSADELGLDVDDEPADEPAAAKTGSKTAAKEGGARSPLTRLVLSLLDAVPAGRARLAAAVLLAATASGA